jgi:hypothetical protein
MSNSREEARISVRQRAAREAVFFWEWITLQLRILDVLVEISALLLLSNKKQRRSWQIHRASLRPLSPGFLNLHAVCSFIALALHGFFWTGHMQKASST